MELNERDGNYSYVKQSWLQLGLGKEATGSVAGATRCVNLRNEVDAAGQGMRHDDAEPMAAAAKKRLPSDWMIYFWQVFNLKLKR